MILAEAPKKGGRAHFAIPYKFYFPGHFNQALPASGLPTRCPFQVYPGPRMQRIHVSWTAANLLNDKAPLPSLSEDHTNLERSWKD